MTGGLATISDVTEAVEAARDVQRSSELYRSLVEAVSGVVIRLNRSGKRTFVSERVKEFQGRSKDELLKGRLGDKMLPEDLDTALERVERMFRNGEPAYDIVTRQMVGDQLRHILANWVPVSMRMGR